MCRKMLPVWMVALALLASSAAFAADAPAAPRSDDEFLETLQPQSEELGEELPGLDGMPAPIFKHGSCTYSGVKCRRCTTSTGSLGYRACDADYCVYDGNVHYHYYNCGGCATVCPI